jgi:hypothetical protein
MSGPLVYLVCDAASIDASGACTAVQYVQAPMLIPPLSIQAGTAIGLAIWGLWALAAAWKSFH